ncbi:hypothetical protein EVAR_30511_1 [Eumeta japonica]|uniref:Uncharacterized protein n=1 Tax=Eumeta variegata TaxID=151549 RepID=A0A4C1W0R4_EUMVA|nr:hypothetical protein EVAR_30511_1 [Eumeta japonica]
MNTSRRERPAARGRRRHLANEATRELLIVSSDDRLLLHNDVSIDGRKKNLQINSPFFFSSASLMSSQNKHRHRLMRADVGQAPHALTQTVTSFGAEEISPRTRLTLITRVRNTNLSILYMRRD